jgi:hypothetical protein
MILFYQPSHARRESPRADRETQESESYFTDHSLTGQSTSVLYYWFTSHNQRRPFFHRSHFEGHSSIQSQPPVGDLHAAGRTVGAGRS